MKIFGVGQEKPQAMAHHEMCGKWTPKKTKMMKDDPGTQYVTKAREEIINSTLKKKKKIPRKPKKNNPSKNNKHDVLRNRHFRTRSHITM